MEELLAKPKFYISTNPMIVIVIIVILIVIIIYLYYKSESYIGYPLSQLRGWDSGGKLRSSSIFTSTNMGPSYSYPGSEGLVTGQGFTGGTYPSYLVGTGGGTSSPTNVQNVLSRKRSQSNYAANQQPLNQPQPVTVPVTTVAPPPPQTTTVTTAPSTSEGYGGMSSSLDDRRLASKLYI